ncbi:MAG: 3-deoxy-7-phosphoheptulonate synthase, partial [Ruminococcus sp.]|nr:3-deoxy-7-phosphoheptulonate synthase [Ruminococcus sp.]
ADPSHAGGLTSLIEPLSLAAIVAGADALEIEVHNDPRSALSDGGQQLTPARFAEVMEKINAAAKFMGCTIG